MHAVYRRHRFCQKWFPDLLSSCSRPGREPSLSLGKVLVGTKVSKQMWEKLFEENAV